MGIALGASFRGMRPIPEVEFADFLWPAVNQLIGEAARVCYGSDGSLNAPVTLRIPYGGGIRGGLFHSQNVEAYFFHTPGLKVVAPATPYDAKGLLKSAIRDNNPVVFLEHKKTYRLVRGDVPEEDYVLPIGKAEVKRPGQNITVVSYGLMVHYCLEAAEQLAAEGVAQVEVVDLRTLKPLDTETVLESVKKTGKLLIVHEDNNYRRHRLGNCRAGRRSGLRLPGRSHRQGLRSRRAHHALRPNPGRRLYAQHPEDSQRPAQPGGLLGN